MHKEKPLRIPKLGLHKPTGQARVWVNGKHVYLGVYGDPKTEERYRRLVAEFTAGRGTIPPPFEELTVGQLVLQYLKYAQEYYGESTSWGNVKTALAPVLTLYSTLPAAEFGPRALRAVRGTWEHGDLSRGTVNKYVGVVKTAFRWAASEEMIPVEIVTALDTLAGLRVGRTEAREPEPIEPVPEADRRAVLLLAPGVLRDMIRVQTFCGCRPGELCALRRGDIDTTGRVWVATVREHKGSWREDAEPREIAFGPRCQRILRKYLLRPAGAYIFDPREAVKQRAAAKPTHRRPGQKPDRRRTRRRTPKPKQPAPLRVRGLDDDPVLREARAIGVRC